MSDLPRTELPTTDDTRALGARLGRRLRAGDLVVLTGDLGAGKTTFVNLVTGTLAPSSGEVRLGGEVITGLDASARVKRGLVRSFQVTRLFQDMTAAEHLALRFFSGKARFSRTVMVS